MDLLLPSLSFSESSSSDEVSLPFDSRSYRCPAAPAPVVSEDSSLCVVAPSLSLTDFLSTDEVSLPFVY